MPLKTQLSRAYSSLVPHSSQPAHCYTASVQSFQPAGFGSPYNLAIRGTGAHLLDVETRFLDFLHPGATSINYFPAQSKTGQNEVLLTIETSISQTKSKLIFLNAAEVTEKLE